MFRRKGEDSLFDTPNDQSLDALDEHETEVNSTQPQAHIVSSGMYGNANVAAGAVPTPPSGQPNSPLARPATTKEQPRNELPRQDVRPSSNFRPASSPLAGGNFGSDNVSRTRPVDTKTTATNTTMGMNVDKATNNKLGNRRVLTVGNDILLKGEIATCDRLVIEGKVDATLNDVHTVEISETGSFKGSADIEDAEISGLFEGDLVVRNRLVIYASGKVRGKITYGEIEIERGGEMTGEIKTIEQENGKASTARRTKKEDDMVAA